MLEEHNEATRGHKFFLDGDEVRSRPATTDEIKTARAAYSNPSMRSCWECNAAHTHFLRDGDDYSFLCFGCGKFFHGGIDVTDYSPDPE